MVLAAMAAVGLVLGRAALLAVALALGIAAAGEILRFERARGVRPLALLSLGGVAAMLSVAHVRGDRAPAALTATTTAVLVAAFATTIVRRSRADVTRAVAATLLPVVVVGLLGAHVLVLRGESNGLRLVLGLGLLALGAEAGSAAAGSRRAAWARVGAAMTGGACGAVVTALTLSPPLGWARALVLAVVVSPAVVAGNGLAVLVERAAPARRLRAGLLRRLDGILLAAPVFFYAYRVLAR